MNRPAEYDCDLCGQEVPNGAGHYVDDLRVCRECHDTPSPMDNYNNK